MAAPPYAVLGPLPAALHHRRDRCVRRVRRARPTGRARRLFAAAVLGLTLPLAAATVAVAAPAPGASAPADAQADAPGPGADEEQADQADQSDQAGGPWPNAAPPQHAVPERSHPDLAGLRAHRHRPAAALERPDTAVEQAPDQVPDQASEQAPDQAVDQAPAQAPDQDVTADQPDPAADTPAPAGDEDTVTTAAQPVAAAAVPALLPARWQDPSTLQLPLGVGLGLIGCGVGLVGLRLRKG
ncbi:hypothetical protein ACFVXG_10450 [Kitasatospora sp. NPDC058162]|uniref:hypothetical protein n=1 Tax=Kitasatospora sp. NPDC058162 TaxID=3346362 RepID=UPI0036DDB2A3